MNQFLRLASAGLLLMFGATIMGAQNQNIAYRSKMTFQNQTLANICGYAADGHEYALLGASKGLIIVEVTNPDAPHQIVQIPGPNNLWKEIKTYSHYAYVTSEGGEGVQIVDLSGLPGATLANHYYTGDGEILGQLNTIHSLHIDTTKGFLYAYGSNLFNGGAVVLNLNGDPYNPTYAGKFDEFGYIHDGWVDNDTLYAAHIGAGFFSITDMSDKSNPVALGLQHTPNNYTHNTWMSKDRHVIFTTDEVDNSYLAAYDISDPTDIKFLDKIQTNPGSNSIVHNTHILDNYAITSWYSDGVSIVDVTQPDNLVQVGNYDVAPGFTGGGFNGCWGVYPFLPSGNIIASVIPSTSTSGGGELWVLTPNYQRASYLKGLITDAANGNPINGATIQIQGGDNGAVANSDISGNYKTGQVTTGTFDVLVSKPGFLPATASVTLSTAQTAVLNVALNSAPTVTVSGQVLQTGTNTPVPNAQVNLRSDDGLFFSINANAAGQFTLPGVFVGQYDLIAGAWGYGYAVKNNQNLNANQNYTLLLTKGYRDDFAMDYGWESSGSSATGVWERAEPQGINVGPILVPEFDIAGDVGDECFVTGNNSATVDEDDVESGTSILRSPVMDLSGYNQPIFKGLIFFTSITFDNQSLDSIKIFVENGTEEALISHLAGFNFGWQILTKNLEPLLPLTSTMRIRIECYDNPDYTDVDSYEAAFDDFKIVEGAPTATEEPLDGAKISVRPNPFRGQAIVEYSTPGSGEYQITVSDLLGKTVQTLTVDGSEGYVALGQDLRPGVYFARLEQDGRVASTIKLVKAE